jgi:hypothetical protein
MFFLEMLLDLDVNGHLKKNVEKYFRKFLGHPYTNIPRVAQGV